MEPPSHPPRETAYREWWYLFDPRYSLRARAALLAGAAAIAFVVLANWFAGTIVRRSLEAQLGTLFETFAFEVGDKIDRVIYEGQQQLQILANLPALRALPADEAGALARRRLLETWQKESPDFAWLGFADGSGRVVAGTQGMFEGASVAMRPWFRGARENAFVGGPREIPELPRDNSVREDETRGRFLDLAVPVTGADGRIAGVLGAHVRWSLAGDVARGVVTDAVTRNQIGATIYGASNDVLYDSGASGWTIPPNAPSVPNPRSFRGAFRENFPMGTPYLTGYYRSRGFRSYRGLGWLIIVRQPISRAFAPAEELQLIMGRWGFAFVAAFALSAWFFITPLARRMHGIALAAKRIRGGDILTVMPRHRGETEMSRMCDALGELVEDMRAKESKPPAEPPPEPSAPVEPREGTYVKPTGADPRRVVW